MSLWKSVIAQKFWEGEWCSKVMRDGYGVGVWKAIGNGWKSFVSRTHFIVGNGRMVKI